MSSKSFSAAYDQRTQFASGSGVQVAPGAAVASPSGGAVNAAAGSAVHQTITSTGFVGEDVAQLLGMIEEDRAGERAALASMNQSLAASVASQADDVSEMLAASKTPDSNTIKQLLPVLLLLAAGYILTR